MNFVIAGTEYVLVLKVYDSDDKAIIVRKNGEQYIIEKGVGCLSLWRFEGKTILIHSPSVFLGVGSKLFIPNLDQECRIWDSEFIGSIDLNDTKDKQKNKKDNSPKSSGLTLLDVLGGVIIADDGQYLGTISNEYTSDSFVNDYGSYGSKYSSTSVNNPYCSYGGKYSSLSPFNKHTSTPPKVFKDGEFVCFLTINSSLSPSVNPYFLIGELK